MVINCFGPEPTNKWNVYKWGAFFWGQGDAFVITTYREVIPESEAPIDSVPTTYQPTTVDSVFLNQVADLFEVSKGVGYDDGVWQIVFPDPTVNIISANIAPAWSIYDAD